MNAARIGSWAAAVAVALFMVPTTAQAHGFWTVGINLGFPGCYRPWCGYGYPYYQPYPVYYAPPPVYVAPPPVYLAPPPAVQSGPVTLPAYPTPVYQSAQTNQVVPAVQRTQTTPVSDARQAEIARLIRELSDSDESVRANGAIQLGKMKATSAIDPVAARLAGDRSPLVREAAARSLGLIGSNKGLPALERAVINDGERDVRRSAQFAMDVIQTNR